MFKVSMTVLAAAIEEPRALKVSYQLADFPRQFLVVRSLTGCRCHLIVADVCIVGQVIHCVRARCPHIQTARVQAENCGERHYQFRFWSCFHSPAIILPALVQLYGIRSMTGRINPNKRSLTMQKLPAVICGVVLFGCLPPIVSAQQDLWPQIAPHVSVPEDFRDDYGDSQSVLKFRDGTVVKSPADWQRRRTEILTEWTQSLGQWPELITEPDVQFLSSERRDNFTQHNVRFKWTPTEFTTGYLLIPDGDGKRPAVLTVFYEPETAVGLKGENRDFAYQLAKRGFVTLSIGTTEATESKTYALYHPNINNATVQPLSMLGYAAANAWYVLASRPEVDSERIGIVGHSFGGKWAMFAGCLFDKFAAVAVSDPGIMFGHHPSVNYWEPWYLGWHPQPWRKRGKITVDNPGRGLYLKLREDNRDLHELHALLAPRPFLVSGGEVDPPERWRALNHLVRINKLLGYEDRVGMTNRPDHSPNPESNAVIYAFFEHFLIRSAQ